MDVFEERDLLVEDEQIDLPGRKQLTFTALLDFSWATFAGGTESAICAWPLVTCRTRWLSSVT